MVRSALHSSRTAGALLAACLSLVHAPESAASSDADAIRHVIASTWDRPEAKVDVAPVVIAGDHAVASWTQGDRGGRALLRRGAGGWEVRLCSGDQIRAAAVMVEAGVPQEEAETIEAGLTREEALLPAERRALFSTFNGIQSIDGTHVPAHGETGAGHSSGHEGHAPH
jgi:hypothetical protein